MKKSYILILLATIAILIGIILGMVLSKNGQTSNLQQEPEFTLAQKEGAKKNESIRTSSNMEVKTSPHTLFLFHTYYQGCGHTQIERKEILEEDVNKTEEDLQEKYRDWGIKEFTTEQVLLYQEKEGICGEHYILKEIEGYVAIYTVDALGKETLQEKTDIITNYLPEADQLQLKEGIRINGQENLNAAIEDYE